MDNDKLRIPVAAPAAGYQFQIVSEKTEFQKRSSQFKVMGRGRRFWPRITNNINGEADPKQDYLRGVPYVRPRRPDEPKPEPIAYVKRDLPADPYLRARMLHYGR